MLVGGKDGSMNGSEEKELKYLNSIHSPQDLKDLPEDVMPELADEIRSELVNIVSRTLAWSSLPWRSTGCSTARTTTLSLT